MQEPLPHQAPPSPPCRTRACDRTPETAPHPPPNAPPLAPPPHPPWPRAPPCSTSRTACLVRTTWQRCCWAGTRRRRGGTTQSSEPHTRAGERAGKRAGGALRLVAWQPPGAWALGAGRRGGPSLAQLSLARPCCWAADCWPTAGSTRKPRALLGLLPASLPSVYTRARRLTRSCPGPWA